LYLAHLPTDHFMLRESHRDGDLLRSRDLFDLGPDPGQFIVYPGGNSFYVSEEVEECLRGHGAIFTDQELENLFLPFLDPELRRKVEPFLNRSSSPGRGDLRPDEAEAIFQAHLFDKRRHYFLRCGTISQTSIFGVSPKLFRDLPGKSRDELEQFFQAEERALPHDQIKLYLYVIFDLQQHFTELIARSLPEGLSPEQMDEAFLVELCRLNDDPTFWAGFERGDRLPPYLARYVWLYFDSWFESGRGEQEFIREFMDSHRQFRWPEPKARVNDDRLSELFGMEAKVLHDMSRRELTRLFREKAHQHHPDKGGEHDSFVELAAAYAELLQGKK
jgi:hypothetical protein